MVCPSCRQTAHLRIRRVLADAQLPPVLVINAGVWTSDELEIWLDGRQGPGTRFLEPRFSIGKQGDAVVVLSQPDLDGTGGVTYELRVRFGLCVQGGRDETDGGSRRWWRRFRRKEILRTWLRSLEVSPLVFLGEERHLSLRRAVSSEAETPGGSWHVFNDFLVRPISETEALSFPSSWKVRGSRPPQKFVIEELLSRSLRSSSTNVSMRTSCSTLLRSRCRQIRRFYARTLPSRGQLSRSVLSNDVADLLSCCRNRDPALVKHQPFQLAELPRRGTLVSIDAEFVSLQQASTYRYGCRTFVYLALYRRRKPSSIRTGRRRSFAPVA